MESLAQLQNEVEAKHDKHEDERWKEMEIEERRREDKEHQMNMMRMLGQMFQAGSKHHNYAEQFDYDY